MFVRLVYESFRRQKRRKLLAGAAITVGVTVATGMIAVATDIGDKINRELRTIGANLVVTPQEDSLDVEIGGVNLKPPTDGAFLSEADLPKIKGIFWHNNIVGCAPILPVSTVIQHEGKPQDVSLTGTYFSKKISYGNEDFVTGAKPLYPWWKVSGAWPDDNSRDVLIGERLAAKLNEQPGNTITISGRQLHINGILSTGGAEDNEVIAPLSLAQEILGRPGAVKRVYVSALTRIEGLIFLISPAALFASGLAVSAAMATAIFERRAEVGLMKALGAGKFAVASVFFAEAALMALIGGSVGFGIGSALARQIGHSIFNSQISISPVLLPVILAIAVIVTFAESAMAIRRAVSLDPVFALRGEL